MMQINIGGRTVGEGQPAYIVAEIGFNHEGDMDLAVRMIEAAAQAGVDAVKFQTYRAADLVLESVVHYNVIKHGELSLEDHRLLAQAARDNGVAFFSTPYGMESVDLLEQVGVPAYKVASMDLTNLPLLRHIAATGKPMIVSTGMATIGEISEAVETIRAAGNDQIILLHCISKYPTPPRDANLRIIPLLRETFGVPVGYSDHVLGNTIALAAVALGACVIEKHFTVDKTLPGPDHSISADPQEMAQLVQDVRTIEEGLGSREAIFRRPDREEAVRFRRGLFARVDIPAGTVITEEMVKCVRPERGLQPKYREWVIGRTAQVTIHKEEPLTWERL